MHALAQKLKQSILDHVAQASQEDILAITSRICSRLEPVHGVSLKVERLDVAPRFTVQADVVTDNLTGLMWMRGTLPGGRRSWSDAKTAAAAVTAGGYTDWRLPTIKELLSIVEYEKSDPAIDSSVFQCESAWYWTSTPLHSSPGDYAWLVDFYGGFSDWYDRNGEGFVRACRPSQLIGTLG